MTEKSLAADVALSTSCATGYASVNEGGNFKQKSGRPYTMGSCE